MAQTVIMGIINCLITVIITLLNEINFLCNACEWKEKKNEGNNEKMQENNKIVHKVKCLK